MTKRKPIQNQSRRAGTASNPLTHQSTPAAITAMTPHQSHSPSTAANSSRCTGKKKSPIITRGAEGNTVFQNVRGYRYPPMPPTAEKYSGR